LGAITEIDPRLMGEPAEGGPGVRQVTWAGRPVEIDVRPAAPAPPSAATREPGEVTVGRAPGRHPPRRLHPSAAPPVPCTLGRPVSLGGALPLRGSPDMERIGRAVHAFLAADRAHLDDDARAALAAGLARRHGVHDALDPGEVLAAATRLWRWLDGHAPTGLHHEWPLSERLPDGTVVAGAADLVARTATGYVLVDHKTFPGTLEAALARLPAYSGQLAGYARVIRAATGAPVVSSWIHLPLLGLVVEVALTADGGLPRG
jgi:hypothetical protein